MLICSRAPLADHCTVCGRRPPRFVFFAISGSACNVAQLAMDRALLLLLADSQHSSTFASTACWTASYTLSISLRHASHSLFVFGMHRDSVLFALGKTHLTYLSTIIASTLINFARSYGRARGDLEARLDED